MDFSLGHFLFALAAFDPEILAVKRARMFGNRQKKVSKSNNAAARNSTVKEQHQSRALYVVAISTLDWTARFSKLFNSRHCQFFVRRGGGGCNWRFPFHARISPHASAVLISLKCSSGDFCSTELALTPTRGEIQFEWISNVNSLITCTIISLHLRDESWESRANGFTNHWF